MGYRYAVDRVDNRDLASGAVLRSAPGFPAFPVRLASEVFGRAAALHGGDRFTVWDPCCGSGYLLTVLGMVHRERLRELAGSDVRPDAVELAAANLALLTDAGLRARTAELAELARQHGKPAHADAVGSARRLAGSPDLPATAGVADVFDPAAVAAVLDGRTPELVITDLPYGEQTTWTGAPDDPVAALLDVFARVLPPSTVIALVVRGRRVPVGGRRAAGTLRIGTRAAAFFRNKLG